MLVKKRVNAQPDIHIPETVSREAQDVLPTLEDPYASPTYADQALDAAGVPVNLDLYEDMVHNLPPIDSRTVLNRSAQGGRRATFCISACASRAQR